MELGDDATYHVERSGPAGRDLDVVFEGGAAAGDRVLLAPAGGAPAPPEPPTRWPRRCATSRHHAGRYRAGRADERAEGRAGRKPAPASRAVPAAEAASASASAGRRR